MKIYHMIFETILIISTTIFLIYNRSPANSIALALGWFVFGTLQVFHSVGLAFSYSKSPAIMRYLKKYIIIAFTDVVVLLISGALDSNSSLQVFEYIAFFTLWISPAMLALYLWFITWHFRRPPVVEKTG